MTQPPSPAITTTMRPCRPEGNLTPNAQGVSGAVPLPAFSLLQKEAQLSRESGHPGCFVKNVRNSFCTLVCTSFFTLARSIWLIEKQVEISDSERAGKKITKTGGSDPTFSAFSRPKSSWGRSRPFCFNPGCVNSRMVLQVNASSHALFTLAFTSRFTLQSGVSLSVLTVSLNPVSASRTSPKHRVVLERPHFVAAESAAVAPAQPLFITTRRIAEPYTDVPARV
jgi:hypothetical protein